MVSEQEPVTDDAGASAEVARFCPRCGQEKLTFDVFCGRCGTPLIRRFRLILTLEIVGFLVTAILFGLERTGKLPPSFAYAPLVFLAHFVALYLVRLYLRQRRFLLMLAVYLGLVVVGLSRIGPHVAFDTLAPAYLCVGVIILWATRIGQAGSRVSVRTLWLGLLIAGWSLALITELDPSIARPPQDASRVLSLIGAYLKAYTPWLSLAGFAATLAGVAGVKVTERGVGVREDYYPDARKSARTGTDPIAAPLFVVPVIIAFRALERAVLSFYNALLTALNLMTRCLVFTWKVILAFLAALWEEALRSIGDMLAFAYWIAVRVLVPFLAVSLAAWVTLRTTFIMKAHVTSPTVSTSSTVLLEFVQLLAAMFAIVLCFGRVSPKEFVESFFRDLAVLIGYGMPLLVLCMITVALLNRASRHYFAIDLGLRFGPLSWACLIVLLIGAVFLWRSRLLGFLRAAQASERFSRTSFKSDAERRSDR